MGSKEPHKPRAKPESPPRCPRCAYDQSGEVARWKESCPLEGVCTECGHVLNWAMVLCPEKYNLAWLPEHATTWRGRMWRSVKLMPRVSFFPRKFWRATGVDARVGAGGLVVYALVAILLPRFLMAIMASLDEFLALHSPSPWGTLTFGGAMTHFAFNLALPRSSWGEPLELGWVFAALLMHLSFGAMFLVLPDTRKHAKLRFAHVARSVVYGITWLSAVELLGALVALGDSVDWFGDFQIAGIWLSYRVENFYINGWPPLLAVVWILAWWRGAIVNGWKLHRGVWLWLLLSIIALIAGLLGMVILTFVRMLFQ